jgi:hypothetical protein
MSQLSYVSAKTPAASGSSFLPVSGSLSQHSDLDTTRSLSDFGVAPLTVQPPLFQTKLTVGQPDDEYEREADKVAETVMRMPQPVLQRKPT